MTDFAIITMATWKYKHYLYELFRSLKYIPYNFDLYIISDAVPNPRNPEASVEENSYKDDLYRAAKEVVKGEVRFVDIPHLPWPIITCCKFLFVNRIIEQANYKFIYYLDAVMRFRKEFKLSDYDTDKFNVWQHFVWDVVDDQTRIGLHNNQIMSLSYISVDDRHNYIHAGMFFGKSEIVHEIGDETQNLMNEEFKRGILPQWHDESCLNYVYNKHPEKFNVIEHQIWDEEAPDRFPGRTIDDFMLSFDNCHDCQAVKGQEV